MSRSVGTGSERPRVRHLHESPAGAASRRAGASGDGAGGTADGAPPPAGRPPGRRRRLLLRRVLPLALVLALVGFGIWALYGSDWLRIEQVRVSGTDVLTRDQVRSAAEVPVGSPMASLDKDAVSDRLREALPRIRSVEVVRAWPNRVGLKVTERQPELVEENADGYVEVDIDGVRFATVDRPPRGVPRLVMDHQRTPNPHHFSAGRLREQAARIAAALPESVRRDTRTVRVRSYDSVTLELTGGREVLWGSGERSSAKAKSLLALMKAEPDAGHFDVSVPSAPAASGS